MIGHLGLLKVLSNNKLFHSLDHLQELTLLAEVGWHGAFMLGSPLVACLDENDGKWYVDVVNLRHLIQIKTVSESLELRPGLSDTKISELN